MIYSDIEDLLFCPDACRYVRDGVYFTDPFFAKVDGEFAYAFLFCDREGDDMLSYGGIVIDPKEKRVRKILDGIEVILPAMSDEKSNIEEYKELFVKLHGLIFDSETSEEGYRVVGKYLELVKKDEYRCLYNVYTELFPEFMEWLENNAE